MRCAWLFLLGGPMLGCAGQDDATAGGDPSICAAGDWLREDGRCVPAGLPPDMPCAPGEWLRETDGICAPAGIAPDGCASGFLHDGDRGCEAVLPQPCAEGLMAVPGETRCREVAPCATGTWGDVPIEPSTEYVDGSYTGGQSDGSPAAPWTSIQAGVDAARPGAIVAVAAGSYLEDVVVQDKPVRLWGRCPQLVELRGSGDEIAALLVFASGTAVRGLAITGEASGIGIAGARDVVLEEVWIHHNAARGIDIETGANSGASSMTLERSLLEHNAITGIFAYGAQATVDASVVRDTQPNLQGVAGRGIDVEINPTVNARARVTVSGSLLERNHDLGLLVYGSDATVDATVVRDTQLDADGGDGLGIAVVDDGVTGQRGSIAVQGSLLERNHSNAMRIHGSDATLAATVLRDSLPNRQGRMGRGAEAQLNPETGAGASLLVQNSLLERHQDIALLGIGSQVTVEATVVRDTARDDMGLSGRGVEIQNDATTGTRGNLVVRGALIERSYDLAIFVFGSDASVEATIVHDTWPAADAFGRAIHVQDDPITGAGASATIEACLLERNTEAGISIAGSATARLEASVIRDTVSFNGLLGDGVIVAEARGPTNVTALGLRIERSERAAVSNFGATVSIGSSLLICQAFDIASEPWIGQVGVYHDLGGVLCGCPEALDRCIAESYALAPPAGVDD